MFRSLRIPLAAAIAVSGCASLESTPTDAPNDGLVYYMPKKDVIVTVVRDATKTTVTVTTSSAYADLERPYVLNYKRNAIGRNELDVGISTTGLLTSTKSTTTAGIGEVLKNLASAAGAFHGMSAPPTSGEKKVCAQGTFTHVYPPDAKELVSPCGMKVTIERVAASKLSQATKDPHTSPKAINVASNGVFYRQEEAYRVKVLGGEEQHAVDTTVLLLSPSQAPVRFLPVASTLFANNKADFTFVDGVPTKYAQDADGELIGLLKLPADVLSAYFGAVGTVFASFKDNDEKEAAALAANTKLELAKTKYEACIAAIRAKDDATLLQLDCSK